MFPLGSVLFPGAVLPLQVFESRYLQMLAELVDGDGRFGVVLIERGSEVGGGDQRLDTATVAQIVRVGKIDDARIAVVAVGEQRVRVREWLPDDPYPVAMVESLEDDPPSSSAGEAMSDARSAFRRTMALASELGYDVADLEAAIPEDLDAGSWYLCDAAPIEQFDRQRLLESPDITSRLTLLTDLLDEGAVVLEARLGGA